MTPGKLDYNQLMLTTDNYSNHAPNKRTPHQRDKRQDEEVWPFKLSELCRPGTNHEFLTK